MENKRIPLVLAALAVVFMLCLTACGSAQQDQPSRNETQSAGGEGGIAVDTEGATMTEFRFLNDGSVGGWHSVYTVMKEGEQYVFTYVDHSIRTLPDDFKIKVDETFMKDLRSLCDKYEVEKWNGFDQVAGDVYDGTSFTLEILFDNEVNVYAHGSNRFPDHFHDFKREADKLFEPLVDELRETQKRDAIEKGVKGELQYVLAEFERLGTGHQDTYRIEWNQDDRNYNFRVRIKSVSGEFFPAGDYEYYANLPPEAIDYKGVHELFEKYNLMQWYGYDEMAPKGEATERFALYLSFEEGAISASGTLPPQNYETFRKAFMELVVNNIERAKAEYGLKLYEE